jgi:hypothetical protein
MFGVANAEVLEEYLKQPPAFASGWATIPIFGDGEGPPSHMLALNRIAPGGNSIVELVGDFQSPFDLLKLTTPPLAIAGRIVAGRDRWGNPIKDETQGLFSDNKPNAGDIFASTMDEITDLSPFSREFKRYLGLTVEGPFSRDFAIKIVKGEEARSKQPGDDPNAISDTIRRLAFPFLVPRDYDQIKAEYSANALWEMYGEANDYNTRDYSDQAQRGRKKLEEQQAVIAAYGDRKSTGQYVEDVRALNAFKKTDPDYKQYLKEAETKAEAEQIMRRVARAITKVYKNTNAPLESSDRFKDFATTEEQHRQDIKERWMKERPASAYPGYENAMKELKMLDDDSPRYSTEPGDSGVFAPKPKKLTNIGAGQAVKEELRQDTKKFLAKKGTRRADLSNPLADPRTKVKKNGVVAKYRGREVMGSVKLAQVRAAEESDSLTIDKNTGMLMTPDVRQTYMHATNQNEIVRKLLKKQGNLRQQARPSSGLGGDEGRFVEELARISGLSPRVVAAWTKLEGGNSFGDWNRLNIGHTDSGPIALTADSRWSDPIEAARLTNSFLKGEFGGPSEEIKAILPNAVGKSDQEQITIITGSGWATDPEYSTKVAEVYNSLPEGQPADPKAAKQLKKINEEVDQAEQAADKLYKAARKEGIPVPRPADGPSREVLGPKQQKGPYAGSRRIVSQILGQPVMGDKEPGHSAGGYHDPTVGNAYAQDIQLGQGNPAEGEPVYTQELLDKITKRIRDMGGQVPDLVMGMGYTTGYLRGYELEIIPDSESNFHGSGPHLHIGAKWTGAKPPPGTVFGSGGSGMGAQTPYTSSGSAGGSGGGLPDVGGKKMSPNDLMSLPLGDGGEKPEDLPSVIDSMTQASDGSVESVVDQLGNLPTPKKKRKPVPRFNPTTRI